MKRIFIVALFSVTLLTAHAQINPVDLSGEVLQLAIPGAAFASTLIWSEEEYKGTWQFIWAAGVSTVVTYGLKYAINKERPNGEKHSFPSGHASRAFMGAAFAQRKFGWKVGIPAYALAAYTGYTRLYANKHDYWDIIGGAAVGVVSSYIFAKPYNNEKINVSFGRQQEAYVLNLNLTF